MKRLVLAVAVLGTAGVLAAAPASAASLCLDASVTVNETSQQVQQCVPGE